jgi:hypothetical protein
VPHLGFTKKKKPKPLFFLLKNFFISFWLGLAAPFCNYFKKESQ